VTWDRLPDMTTYPKARRKELLRRIGGILTGNPTTNLLSLDDVQETIHGYQQSYAGLRSIPVASIIGSVARSEDFDDAFLPRSGKLAKRWQNVENVFPDGAFPPISVYKVGEAYFVSDGHHRVAIAKQRKIDFIDAEITEVQTPYEVTPETDVKRLVHLGQQRLFMEESGLAEILPRVQFTFTRPEGYRQLLDNLKVHGWDLVVSRGEYVPREEIAVHWYTKVYKPTVQKIIDSGLVEMCGGLTADDLYVWVTERWRMLFPERGPLSFEDIITEASDEEGDKLSNRARAAVGRVDDAIDDVVDRVLRKGPE